MSSLRKATPGEGTGGERLSGRNKLSPGRECPTLLARAGKNRDWKGRKEPNPAGHLRPTVMQILWKRRSPLEDFKQQGCLVCVYF